MSKNKIIQIVALPQDQLIDKYPSATIKDRLILSLDGSRILVDLDGERYQVVKSISQTQIQDINKSILGLSQDVQELKDSIGLIQTQLTNIVGE